MNGPIDEATTTAELLARSLAKYWADFPGADVTGCLVVSQLEQLARDKGTVGPSFEEMFARPQDYLAALRWEAANMLDVLPPGIRRRLIELIAEVDPPTACRIYMRRADLSDGEDAVLWASFAPRMPTMRRGFERGRVKRAKANG